MQPECWYSLTIVDMTQIIAELAASLFRKHKATIIVDYMLAATAISLDAELVTLNMKHFQLLEEVRLLICLNYSFHLLGVTAPVAYLHFSSKSTIVSMKRKSTMLHRRSDGRPVCESGDIKLGGAALNSAIWTKRQGAATSIVTAVGNDEGETRLQKT